MRKFDITGMSCAACSARVEKAVRGLDGIESCDVNLLTNSMSVSGSVTDEKIINAVINAGYGASVQGQKKREDDSLKDRETPLLLKRLAASLAFLILLMYISMGYVMWNLPLPQFLSGNPIAIGLTQLLLTTVVMVINQKFFINGFKGIIKGAPNMDTLVSLGSAAAFIYSTYELYAMTVSLSHSHLHNLYFESAAMILTLITVGKMLEAKSKGRTTDALKGLMKLSPKTATVIRSGEEIVVNIEQVKVGDIFTVKAGESVPVDGVIEEGICSVDESAITGESIPVDKTAGDSVFPACVCKSGFIKCRATRVGEDTTLSQIIKMVSDAAASKAPIARIADKVSGVFVPFVIAVAVIATVIWLISGQSFGYALARGISVLVISCPCALGLATPVAIMVGSGVGAKRGILFKTAATLENAGKTEIVVLDKTGTVTSGTPKVTDIISDNSERLLHLAASLEKKSEHPLSLAIIKKANEQGIALEETVNFTTHPGKGVTAYINNNLIAGGKTDFIKDYCSVPDSAREQAKALSDTGKTPLFFCQNDEFLGIIAVSDSIKPDSPEAVSTLHKMGIRVVMLTGDNEGSARAIGRQAGIDEIISEVLPEGKEREIRRLKEQGKVLMAGDGINDAPALTAADIGVAVASGTDIAASAADIVLLNSTLTDIPALITLSRAVLRNIKQNLFWAFIYNALGIPLAAGAFISLLGWQLNPMFGAAAMSLSSFCVVINALRLNLINIYSAKSRKAKTKKEKETMKNTIKIEGMMCPHCEARVKSILEEMSEVESAIVSHKDGTAIVTLKEEINDEILKNVVENAGYKVLSIDI